MKKGRMTDAEEICGIGDVQPLARGSSEEQLVRGEGRGRVLASERTRGHALALLALGGSVGTPEGGLTAEVIEVRSLEEVAALGDKAKGKVKETVGVATGDRQLEADGKLDSAKGKVKEVVEGLPEVR